MSEVNSLISRLEAREILAHVNKTSIDPDVLQKLTDLAQNTSTIKLTTQTVGERVDEIPPYVPVVYTDAQLDKMRMDDGSTPTQADVAQINEIKRIAHESEWRTRMNYRANLNPTDTVNAAFDAPERPNGFNPVIALLEIGEKNEAGDTCVNNTGGVSIYRCPEGHGYTQSRSLRTCGTCFIVGNTAAKEEDPGVVTGSDSNW